MKQSQGSGPPPTSDGPSRPGLPEVTTEDLLGPQREIVLVHRGERYRLRITGRDKLILTK